MLCALLIWKNKNEREFISRIIDSFKLNKYFFLSLGANFSLPILSSSMSITQCLNLQTDNKWTSFQVPL